MSIFNFSEPELLTFFAVLVRFSVLIAVLPLFGDRFIPTPAKILLSLAITMALFPALVKNGVVDPAGAARWGQTASGIVGVIAVETVIALLLGFMAKLAFDAVGFGGHLVGTFMGFAAASMYDPHQEAHTQVVAELQAAIAMLIFLTLDGHHLMLRAALESYRVVGLGAMASQLKPIFSERLIAITAQVIRLGIQLAAPVAVSIFAVNVAFGIIAKAMPQINVLVLSFSVTAIVGLLVMLIGVSEFSESAAEIFGKSGDWMEGALVALKR